MAHALINRFGEDGVPVMDEYAVRVVSRDRFTQLLDRPLSGGMRCHIDMKEPAAGMLNDNKHIKHAEGRGDRYAKVTCHDAFGVIAKKSGPALRLAAFARTANTVIRHIFTHGSWRDLQAEFEQQLVGDAFLAPRRVLQGHPSNQRL